MAKITPIRESVTTIADDGGRIFLHPADVRGVFTNWRRIVGGLLISIYVLLPWIPINGHPALFFDTVDRRFHIFGLTFAAQDFWLAFFFITGLGFSLFFITSLLGRIWCGWTCPQTVFLEHVYRRIERAIEGNSAAQRKLDGQPWNSEKIMKRGGKQVIFLLISTIIAHIFLSYFVSIPELYKWMTMSPTEHWSAFLFVFIATGVLHFNFTWFREQLCLVICPYGRFQSALIDDDTMIIGYDEKRGEPRGPVKDPNAGDCIACNRCVQVCPTGIDIRQGLQIECIGCANCVDACDEMMEKVGRPKGLVRYDSLNGLSGIKRRIFRPRIALYLVMLLIGCSVMAFSATKLKQAHMSVVRMAGVPYIVQEDTVRNAFMVRLINKQDLPVSFTVMVDSPIIHDKQGFEAPVTVPPLGEVVQPMVITIDRAEFTEKFSFDVKAVDSSGEIELMRNAEFLGPILLPSS